MTRETDLWNTEAQRIIIKDLTTLCLFSFSVTARTSGEAAVKEEYRSDSYAFSRSFFTTHTHTHILYYPFYHSVHQTIHKLNHLKGKVLVN